MQGASYIVFIYRRLCVALAGFLAMAFCVVAALPPDICLHWPLADIPVQLPVPFLHVPMPMVVLLPAAEAVPATAPTRAVAIRIEWIVFMFLSFSPLHSSDHSGHLKGSNGIDYATIMPIDIMEYKRRFTARVSSFWRYIANL